MAHRIPYETLLFEISRRGLRVELGRDSFGSVYAATWLGEEVAVKALDARGLSKDDLSGLWREVLLQYTVRHEHIVAVHGAAEDDSGGGGVEEFAIVMARMSGGTLAEWLARAPALPSLRASSTCTTSRPRCASCTLATSCTAT